MFYLVFLQADWVDSQWREIRLKQPPRLGEWGFFSILCSNCTKCYYELVSGRASIAARQGGLHLDEL